MKTPLNTFVSSKSGNGKLIKGRQIKEFREGLFPAYSASGQDIWRESFEHEGDAVILSAVGARCGKAFEAKGKWSAVANTHVLRGHSKVSDNRFLWFLFNNERFWERGGSAQPFVRTKKTLEKEINLPPLAEQRRIVSKIDELFSAIEAGERAVARARDAVGRYRKSVLKAAVTGELTADWRAANPPTETADALLTRIRKARFAAWKKAELEKLDAKGKPRPKTEKQWEKFRGRYKEAASPLEDANSKELPKNWVLASLEEITDITGGVTVNRKRVPNDPVTVPYLRVANVKAGHLDLSVLKEITVERSKVYDKRLLPGDILLNEGGDLDKLGRGWIWEGQIEDCIHQNHVFRARPIISELSSKYITFHANHSVQAYCIAEGKQSVNLASISKTAISKYPVALPPLDEQREIVSRVEAALSQADAVEASLEAQTRQARALKQSILKRAFAGKLVPQDPNDEPASELLKRIKAA